MRDYVAAGGTTTYFLYDGASPVLEETYSGGTTTIQVANGYADGWRERYGATSLGFNAYGFDPQGSLTIEDSSFNTTLPAQNEYVYDGYGDRLVGERVSTGSTTAFNIDPVQFGGQWGYYQDLQTGLEHLGARYYDGGTGRFVTRDPIGYGGGENLYAFCGNNPITRSDPDGTDALIFWGTNKQGGKSQYNRWQIAANGVAKDYDEMAEAAEFEAHSRLGQGLPKHPPAKAYVIGNINGLTLADVQQAFKTHKDIDTIIYVGHAGPGKLYMSPTFNMRAADVFTLDTSNVEKVPTIELDGCDTAGTTTGGEESISKAFANHFQAYVQAYIGGSSFGIPIPFGTKEIYRFNPDRPRTLGWQFGQSAEPVTIAPSGRQ